MPAVAGSAEAARRRSQEAAVFNDAIASGHAAAGHAAPAAGGLLGMTERGAHGVAPKGLAAESDRAAHAPQVLSVRTPRLSTARGGTGAYWAAGRVDQLVRRRCWAEVRDVWDAVGIAVRNVGCGRGVGGLAVRERENLAPRRLAATDGAQSPCVSPNGETVAYCGRNALWTVPVLGAVPTRIASGSIGEN